MASRLWLHLWTYPLRYVVDVDVGEDGPHLPVHLQDRPELLPDLRHCNRMTLTLGRWDIEALI